MNPTLVRARRRAFQEEAKCKDAEVEKRLTLWVDVSGRHGKWECREGRERWPDNISKLGQGKAL